MERVHTILLDDMMKEAVLTALGSTAWNCKKTPAFRTYNETFKEIQRQLKEARG